MRRSINRTVTLGLAAVGLLCAGCGKKTGEVKGTVRFMNKPLPVAMIFFSDGKGRTVSGRVTGGSFCVNDVPTGDNIKVLISTDALLGKIKEMEDRHRPPPGQQPIPEGVELPP